MKVRSLTLFWPVEPPSDGPDFGAGQLDPAGAFARAGRRALEDAGYEVQTVRLATQPWLGGLAERQRAAVEHAVRIEQAIAQLGFDYVSVGPAGGAWAVVPEIVAATERVFATVSLTTADGAVDLAAAHRSATIVRAIAGRTEHGFGNLRFAAAAACGPGIPFFPVAYHAGGPPVCALALEAADLAVAAFTDAPSLDGARSALVSQLSIAGAELERVLAPVCDERGVGFAGVDLSLAPFPEESRSIGTALERLGVGTFGASGTLFAAAFVTSCLRQVAARVVGYSGLMLPLLEDAVIAARTREGWITLDKLLAYSAVCGLGLDTVPLPGDVAEAALVGVFLDVAALATRLNKPLTARLMPVPGLRAGQPTRFDFPFFASSTALALPDGGGRWPPAGLLAL